MLKSFLRARGSQEVSFWEEYFSAQSYDYLVGSFPSDPIRPLFERYCADGARVLEGGCGLGNYLLCLRNLGARPIGLDFGVDMLKAVRRREPATPLAAGDVGALPFHDGSFDVYYSGGVMEHFENGPGPLIREAHRVLKQGGILLTSVPYENAIRHRRARTRGEHNGLVTQIVDAERSSEPPAGHAFFQYFYRAPEFRQQLVNNGFEVMGEQPYSMWGGLTELAFFQWVNNLYAGRAPVDRTRVGGGGEQPRTWSSPAWKSRLKHLMFAEDRTIPMLGRIVSVGCELAANMRMYICRRP
jgi:SAM-dependent methyltransferase